ncbi:hypothetical protein [Clostridium sp. DMHC 10]|uniref:hypothetical protein n=1 Tax=Clostridium sp. DMHC 10 TaxID=747377 RepID=UPI000B31DC03|nr:hypothetical protein [Clostridium sp. DMHC 10]
MKYKNRETNYDKEPEVVVKGYENSAFSGYHNIISEIKSKVNKEKFIITIDCYPGVKDEEVLNAFINGLNPDCVIASKDIFYDGNMLNNLLNRNLTEDRVFGIMYYGTIQDFVVKEKYVETKKKLDDIDNGIILIYGVGASLISEGDIFVYADLARWEIQQRFRRKELGNFKVNNLEEDILRKYKRAFFY